VKQRREQNLETENGGQSRKLDAGTGRLETQARRPAGKQAAAESKKKTKSGRERPETWRTEPPPDRRQMKICALHARDLEAGAAAEIGTHFAQAWTGSGHEHETQDSKNRVARPNHAEATIRRGKRDWTPDLQGEHLGRSLDRTANNETSQRGRTAPLTRAASKENKQDLRSTNSMQRRFFH
jgi:hypothetical protein